MNFEDVNARAVLDRVDTRGGARRFGWVASGTRNVAEYPAPIALLPVLSLAVEELLAISDGVATTIRITSGEVWITEEGSIIDHILCAGEQYTFDRPGRALVAARKESRIALYSPEIGVPPKRVERIRPRRAANELLYARSLLLSVIAGLIPFWARRPAVAA